MLTTLIKQPAESTSVALTFGDTVVDLVGTEVAARGLVSGSTPLTAGTTIGGALVEVMLAGGTDGERYLVTVRAQLASGDTEEREIDIAVIEASWALPDGGAPWLSIGEFVARIGYREVVAATDDTGEGRIDRDLLTRALADAQATAESYIASRYALPLASVPPLLAMTVADLACVRLYPRGAPDGVKANAAAATNLLQRVQSGTATLPIAGTVPVAAPTETPVLIVAGRRAYPDNLAGY